jgi:polyhydroxyalkanoate synthase
LTRIKAYEPTRNKNDSANPPSLCQMKNTPTSALPQPGNTLDRWAHAQLSSLTRGVSTAALRMAFDDWLTHLSHNPAEQLELTQKALQSIQQLASYTPRATQTSCKPCIQPMVQDRRFTHASWQTWPFNVISQSFLLTQQWWQDATTGVRGVSPHHESVVSFTVRQLLDMGSPANFVWTNPEVLERTAKTGGANLWRGFQNFVEDAQRLLAQAAPPGTIKSVRTWRSRRAR